MKIQATLFSILTTGILTTSSGAQTVGIPVPSGKLDSLKLDSTKRPVVRLVSLGKGKEIVALSPAKAAAAADRKIRLALADSSTGLVLAKAESKAKTMTFPAIVIGATGGGTTVGATTVDMVVVRARANAGAASFSANPLAATIERQVFRGDLPRDTTLVREGTTPGGVATTGSLVIGPNGFPVLSETAAPQGGTNPIGPNGFPELTTTGPRGGIQPIAPNGFPSTNVAPFAQTGSTRAGTSRDATQPVTSTPATNASGISSGATGLPAMTAPVASPR